MAESDSILQLGIEAARDGNREEARNLFRLLTRQDPSNAQAWLWLAGVAENRDERQVALERVVELDPDNEMAVKGLLALGVRPPVRTREEPMAPTIAAGSVEPEPEAVVPPVIPEPAAERSRYDIDDDDPYAALDTLSDAMAESPAAVRRTDPEPSDIDSLDDFSDDPDRPSRRGRTRDTVRGNRYARIDDDEEETVPARRGVSPLLLGIVILALVLLLALLAWPLLRGRSSGVASTGGTQTSATQGGTAGTDGTSGGVAGGSGTATGDATAVAGGVASGDATAAAGGVAAGDTTAVAGDATAAAGGAAASDATAAAGGAPAPAGEATAVPAQPATSPPQQPPADVSGAAPALVAPNTPLESNGWLYDFNQPTYAAPINGGLGSVQPQGRFVVVLAFLANRTGTTQPIPADFFVLKDAQGRVYPASPAASSAYVQRGINADLSLEDPVPADGLTRSVALIFDVQPDATNLVFFARSKTDQGWQVLSSVQ